MKEIQNPEKCIKDFIPIYKNEVCELYKHILQPERQNSLGLDISDSITVSQLANNIKDLSDKKWQVGPLINGQLIFDDKKLYLHSIMRSAKSVSNIQIIFF